MSSRSHSRRRRRCDPVRRIAYTALLATETRGAYANLALAEQLRMSALTAVSYTHLTLPTIYSATLCRSRWSPYH